MIFFLRLRNNCSQAYLCGPIPLLKAAGRGLDPDLAYYVIPFVYMVPRPLEITLWFDHFHNISISGISWPKTSLV